MNSKAEVIEAVLAQFQGSLTEEEQRQLRSALEKSLTVGPVQVLMENDQIEWPTCVIGHADGSPMLVSVASNKTKPDGFAAFLSEEDAIGFKLAGGVGDEWRIIPTDRLLLRVLCERASRMGLEYMAIHRMEAGKLEGFALRLTEAVKLLLEK